MFSDGRATSWLKGQIITDIIHVGYGDFTVASIYYHMYFP